jgi:transketolase C-terminal domain/subunit
MLNTILNPTTLAWIARRILSEGGMLLAAHGFITEGDVPAVVGSAMFLGGLAWNVFSTFISNRAKVSVKNTAL